MSASFQFAPIKVYSAAKSNVKCKAITEFVKSLLDRQSFDRYNTNREAIVQTVQDECNILNTKLPDINGKLEASSISTEEFGRAEDWWLKMRIMKDNGQSLKVCEIACFSCMGPMNEGAVTHSMGIARSVHTKLGIAGVNPIERMGGEILIVPLLSPNYISVMKRGHTPVRQTLDVDCIRECQQSLLSD